ncbi:MAG: CFI-box-CTERM domain-containing protein [Thermodesulfobacteriota bacterium]
MKLKRIGLMGIVFTFTICLACTFGSLSFAQCPSDYPDDCEDEWCCENALACLLPEELRSLFCTKKPELECPIESLYTESSEETELLRKFRDDVLSQTKVGQIIIKQYYEMSPIIVKAIEEDEVFKEDMKEMIEGVLGLVGGEQ